MQGNLDGQVGIILTRDVITKEFKYFIGYVENYKSKDGEEADIEKIIAWGTKFLMADFRRNFGAMMFDGVGAEDNIAEEIK